MIETTQLLSDLKRYQADRRDETTDRCMQTLHTICDPHESFFRNAGIVLTYHGSLQYNDPVNADADVLFIGNNIGFMEGRTIRSIENKIEESWPTAGGTNFCTLDLAQIKQDGSYDGGFFGSMVLSSSFFFPSQEKDIEAYRRQILSLAQDDAEFCRGMIESLRSTLETRMERRGVINL